MMRWTGGGFSEQPEETGAIAFYLDEPLIEVELRVIDEPPPGAESEDRAECGTR